MSVLELVDPNAVNVEPEGKPAAGKRQTAAVRASQIQNTDAGAAIIKVCKNALATEQHQFCFPSRHR